jgi:hypothetical protein
MLHLILLLSAAAAAAVPVENVSLDQLKANPKVYSGKMVRVAGQMDQCWNMSCRLCPAEATPASPQWERCLELSFDRFRGGDGNFGADMNSAFRYADLVVVARFDPTCLNDWCLDKGSVLLDARVEEVTRRRRSRDGLMRPAGRLLPAPGNEAAWVQALLRTQQGDEPQPGVRVFAVRSDPRLLRSALVCRARSNPDDEPPEWPTSYRGALTSSTEDPYRCWTAFKGRTGWVLDPR